MPNLTNPFADSVVPGPGHGPVLPLAPRRDVAAQRKLDAGTERLIADLRIYGWLLAPSPEAREVAAR